MQVVQPATGEVVYDGFQDTAPRPDLETRLTHFQPSEVIVPDCVSMETRRLLTSLHAYG